jgi:uncharacterized protein YrzB (UPF0473 family)
MADEVLYVDDNNIIPIRMEDGTEEQFEILYIFENQKTGYSYIYLVPVEEDEEDEEQEVLAFRYIEEEEGFRLEPIETNEEWDEVEEVLNTLIADLPEADQK